ncbi:MAG: hypothetical protein QGI60_05805 [archaeon]|jgi:hypothetical protein|nr:hypothetical protein [archaeon]
MKCPKCGVEMLRVGLEEVSGNKIYVSMSCPACHFRTQSEKTKPGVQPIL